MKIVTAYDLGAETARKHIAQTKTAFELGTGSALFKSAAPEPPTPPQTVPRENVTYDDDTTYPGYKIKRTTGTTDPAEINAHRAKVQADREKAISNDPIEEFLSRSRQSYKSPVGAYPARQPKAPMPPAPSPQPVEGLTYDDDTTYPGYNIKRTTTQTAPKLPVSPAPKLPEPPAAHPQEQVTYDDNDTIPGFKIKRTITRPVPKPVPPAAPPSTSSPAV